jgi:hypothetical protein
MKGLDSEDLRRRRRASWPVARYALGEEPSEDLSEVTTPAQRVAMMAELAEAAWRLAGRAIPSYERRSAPGRLFRPGEPRPRDE